MFTNIKKEVMKITLQNPVVDMLFELKDQDGLSLNNLIFKAVQMYYLNNKKGIQDGQHELNTKEPS